MDFALICSWGSIFMWLISIFSRTQPKIGTNQALKGEIYGIGLIYKASVAYMIILSQHLVPRDSESPAVPPPKFGGR